MKQVIPQKCRSMYWKYLKKPVITTHERSKYKPREILSSINGNERIAEIIREATPTAIGKIGGTELASLVFYTKILAGSQNNNELIHYAHKLNMESGVFPENESVFKNFCDDFLKILEHMDYLAVWFNPGEATIVNQYAPNAMLSELTSLEPYYHLHPWSQELKNKKVLIINSFTDSIKQQYEKRNYVWQNKPLVLPDFVLKTIKVPLYAAVVKPQFKDWFETLKAIKNQMSEIDFDVAIIGAGAWSLPLAVHAKTIGKIGIHLGGATQILFGIKGSRWQNHRIISNYFNDYWCYPSASETPPQSVTVGDGYW